MKFTIIVIIMALLMNGCALDELVDPMEIKMDDMNRKMDNMRNQIEDTNKILENGIDVRVGGF